MVGCMLRCMDYSAHPALASHEQYLGLGPRSRPLFWPGPARTFYAESSFRLTQQLRQLGDVGGDPPRLVTGLKLAH
jgi:hypothetical protein